MHGMTAVFRLFFGICLLRNGPEAVPTQAWFLSALVAANLACAVFLFGAVAPTMSAALAVNVALIGIVTTAAMTWFVLYVRNLEPRFPATLGATLGTQLIIATAMLVGINLVGPDGWGPASLVFLIWAVVVAGFILHRALSCRLWLGVLLAVGIRVVGDIIAMAVLDSAIAGPMSLT